MELLNCPFCGGKAFLNQNYSRKYKTFFFLSDVMTVERVEERVPAMKVALNATGIMMLVTEQNGHGINEIIKGGLTYAET